jgi:hypothetical protein
VRQAKNKNRGAHAAPRFEIQSNQAGMLSVSGEKCARIIMHMLHMRIPIMLLTVRVMDAVSFHLDYFKL